MPTLTLRLEVDPASGRKHVWVKYDGEPDALPHEHEAAHKALVQALLAGGVVTEGELGTLTIEREGQGGVAAPAAPAPEAARQAAAVKR